MPAQRPLPIAVVVVLDDEEVVKGERGPGLRLGQGDDPRQRRRQQLSEGLELADLQVDRGVLRVPVA